MHFTLFLLDRAPSSLSIIPVRRVRRRGRLSERMEYQVKDMTNGDPIVEDLADDGPDAYDVSTDNIIDFEGPDDPSNPMNWSALYKWSMVILISILSLIV